MPIAIGSQTVQAVKLGAADVTAVMIGSTLVWSKTSIYQTFEVPDAANLTALGWVHYGPASAYKAGVVGGVCRMAVTDGFGTLGYFTDRVRFNTAVAPADDGYLQCRVSTPGDGASPSSDDFITDVFRRGSNGAVTHGVGVRLLRSGLSIVRRVAGTDTVMASCGAFAAGDVCRLAQVGNLHTLTRNGNFVGEWNDSGATASVGDGFRSLLMRVDGDKEISGKRWFSPAIDYVECG